MQLPYGYQADIKRIKAAGFSHIKVELEAHLNRENSFDDEDYCKSYITDQLDPELVEAMTYYDFYNDGSVDSEFTFTLPIEQAHRAIDVVQAFSALADSNGYGIDTNRAGVHLTLMTSGMYPTTKRLSAARLANFTTQVTKLLPALYAASSHNGLTRSFEFRQPKIGAVKSMSTSEYPMICTHGGTCLEYRLFDTCYDKPEALLEQIQIIAGTIVYFDARRKLKLKSKSFTMETVTRERQSKREFKHTIKDRKNYEALKETVKYIKPKGTSLKAFLAARGLDMTVKQVQSFERAIDLRLGLNYQAYLNNYMNTVYEYLARWLKDHNPAISTAQQIQTVYPAFETWYQSNVNRSGTKPKTFDDWLHNQGRPGIYENVLKEFDLTEPERPVARRVQLVELSMHRSTLFANEAIIGLPRDY